MLTIPFNQHLFDKHVEEVDKKLRQKINGFDPSKLSNQTVCCLNEIYNNSKIILGADTKELKKIIIYFETNFYCGIGYEENKNTELYQTLSKIFIDDNTGLYKNFTNYKKEYDVYKFVKTLDLKTCPYCNRNYTFVVDEKSGKLRPEIDHFYPKSIYPFLAMSFYNLIPSCQICNHTKSSTLKEELENPYDITPNSYKFTYIPKNIDFTLVEDDEYNFDNFEIKITGKKDNLELFKLNELYEQHKDIVLELLVKKVYYPKSYIEELERFGFKSDEIYRYLLCNYQKDEDLHKRPLSKLIKDISEELELI